ncbi:MAG TPA: hypothetical protein VHH72_06160 [Solirubrobacterales bacterium]|nr:hypothetical protein [Solirubrobacterales bacterium]
MNPLQEARNRAARSWRTARDGTKRTTGWVTGGLRGAFRRAGGAVPRAGFPGRIRARPRAAAAWAGAALLVAAWIGWTVYAWIENGAAAGIGVLISWPAVAVALALLASPFVGAGLLVRRHRRAADGPAVAAGDATEAADGSDADSEAETADGSDVDSEAETAAGDETPAEDEETPDDGRTADGDATADGDGPRAEGEARERDEAEAG